MRKPCSKVLIRALLCLLIAAPGLLSCNLSALRVPPSQPCRECHEKLSPGHDIHFSLPVRLGVYGNESSFKDTAGYAFNCGVCHPLDPSLHGDGKTDVELSNPSAKGLKALTPKGLFDPVAKTCADVYCHSFRQTPPWGGKFEAGKRCRSCHDTPPSSDAHFNIRQGTGHLLGIHWDSYGGHGKDTGKEFMIGCNTCHYAIVLKEDTTLIHTVKGRKGVFSCDRCHTPEQGDIRDHNLHVNGRVDVIFSPYKVRSRAQLINEPEGWRRVIEKGSRGAYDEAIKPLNTAVYKRETKTCLNVACHLGIAVAWNDKVDCASCHKGY